MLRRAGRSAAGEHLVQPLDRLPLPGATWFGWTSCLAAIACTVRSPRNASSATRFLKSAVNRRRRFVVIPVPPQGPGIHLGRLSENPRPPHCSRCPGEVEDEAGRAVGDGPAALLPTHRIDPLPTRRWTTGVWSSTRPENQPWATRSVGRIAHHRHSCSGPQLPAGALEPETTPRSNADRYIGSKARRLPVHSFGAPAFGAPRTDRASVGHANAAPAGVFGPPEGEADAGFEDGRVVIGSAPRSHRVDGPSLPPSVGLASSGRDSH